MKKKKEKKIHKNLMEKEASDASSDTNDGHHQPALPSKLVGLFSKPAGVNLKKDGKKVKVLASFVSSYRANLNLAVRRQIVHGIVGVEQFSLLLRILVIH